MSSKLDRDQGATKKEDQAAARAAVAWAPARWTSIGPVERGAQRVRDFQVGVGLFEDAEGLNMYDGDVQDARHHQSAQRSESRPAPRLGVLH